VTASVMPPSQLQRGPSAAQLQGQPAGFPDAGGGRNPYRSQESASDHGRQNAAHSLAPDPLGMAVPGQEGPRLVGPSPEYGDGSVPGRFADGPGRFAESRFAEEPGRFAESRFANGPSTARFANGPASQRYADSPERGGFADGPAQARFAGGPGPAQYPPAQMPGYGQPQHEQGSYGASAPPEQQMAVSLADAVQAAHAEGFGFGDAVARDAPALWLEAVLARKPRMPSDLEARLLQGSALPIDSLLHDEVRHSLRRGFWDALERSRR
jgi:hypothetical protein